MVGRLDLWLFDGRNTFDLTFAYLLHRARPAKKTHHDKAFADQHKPVQAISPQKSAGVYCNIPRAKEILESFLDCRVGDCGDLWRVVITPIIRTLVISESVDTCRFHLGRLVQGGKR